MNTQYQRRFTSTNSSTLDIVSACQRMNQLTFMSYIRARSGLTYLDQISKYLSTDRTISFSADEIASYAKDKQLWNLSIAVHMLPVR